ncbi:MAG: YeeE/YedE family protein [Verrucomicrobia bacterium]|nr:YeeE/YedE family protein [Verrucomicrobiota bacterium]
MNAPFFRFGAFNDETSLIVAFVIGLAFGFFLERAGFGSARKLTAQFYFKDLSVLKVMFTAILTAMTGLYVVSRFGLVDLSLVHLTPTFLVPQLLGGVLLGIGFVIGGYCPGTSVVSAATGRLDAVVFLGGMFAGTLAIGFASPVLAPLASLTAFGARTLPAVLHLPHGVVVLAVVVLAIGAFVAAEWAERKLGGVEPGPGSLLGSPRPLNPARGLVAGLLGLGLVAAVAGNPYREGRVRLDARRLAELAGSAVDQVTAEDLGAWIIEGRADFVLVDLRSEAEYARHRIPGARHVPLASLDDTIVPRTEKLVLYAASEAQAAQAWVLLKAQGFKAVYTLAGGLDAWNHEVLFPAAPAEETPSANAAFARRVAVARHLGGSPRGAAVGTPEPPSNLGPPPTPATTPGSKSAAPVAKKKREGC